MAIIKLQNKITYGFVVFLLFSFYSASSFAAFSKTLVWPSLDNQQCNSYGTVSYLQQAVGILELNHSLKIRIPVPRNASYAYFAAKSHAPKPSMEFSKTNFSSICYLADASQCPDDQIPIAFNGTGDTLAPVNKSYVDKNLEVDSADVNLFVYQTNMGENFGTSSMYAASIAFRLTPEECANRAAGGSTANAGAITNIDGSTIVDTISYTTDSDVLLKENLRDKNSTLNELYSSNNSQFKLLQTTNEVVLSSVGAVGFVGSKSTSFQYELVDSNNATLATGTVEITVKGDEIFNTAEVTVATIDQPSEIKLKHDPVFFRDGMLHINRLMLEVDGEVFEGWADLKYIPGTSDLEVVASGLIDKSKLNENGLVDQDGDGLSIDEGDCNDNDETVYPDSPGNENPDKTFNCSLE